MLIICRELREIYHLGLIPGLGKHYIQASSPLYATGHPPHKCTEPLAQSPIMLQKHYENHRIRGWKMQKLIRSGGKSKNIRGFQSKKWEIFQL